MPKLYLGHVGGLGGLLGLIVCMVALNTPTAAIAEDSICGGELRIVGPGSEKAPACPLKHTDVSADIVGFFARTTVKQVFYNPLDFKIEAVYVFPLPQNAAVDDMTMLVGDRRIIGQVKERGEAKEIYEAAKAAGHVASLLDQERPNIFTQSVANIEPGVTVEIEISYVETLKYEDGVFEWVFPMVVGPRYIPGGGSAPAPMTTGKPTGQVPDGDRITPPVIPEGMRAGHDIGLTVTIDAGMELHGLESTLHEVDVVADGATRAAVALKDQATIPNKDFILRYSLASDEIGDAFLAHHDQRGDFFTLILQPPERVVPSMVVPRELIFVLDTSGSMSGFPIEKSKAVMKKMLDTMRPGDTFNIITFAGSTRIMWKEPRPNTVENLAEAQVFVSNLRGGGGTEMMKAINAALVQTRRARITEDVAPIRIVGFFTDGYVGNDMAIIDAVRKNADTTRVFSFGVGNSVNRYLLDGMARAGRGEVEYVTLEAQGDEAVERFHERLLAPVLTDIEIDWGTLPVADVYPQRVPDLFSAKPIVVHGRLTGPAAGTITLRGNTGGGAYEEQIAVSEPAEPPDNDALASLWARAKVDDLMNRDLQALQTGAGLDDPESEISKIKSEIIDVGVEFRLMTQFTSFVAVEEMTVTIGGEPTKINVPVEMPDGVSYDGVFGDKLMLGQAVQLRSLAYVAPRGGAPAASGGRLAGRAAPPKPMPKSSGTRRKVPAATANLDAAELEERFDDAPRTPADKLAKPLRDLAKRVEKDGDDGDLSADGLKVVDYKIDVMVYFSDLSDETLKALGKLGFVKTGESKTVKLLVGRIDVRKLEELAKLDAVVAVKPVQR